MQGHILNGLFFVCFLRGMDWEVESFKSEGENVVITKEGNFPKKV